MFTLDSDLVGLQQHIQEFNPIFRQAFKSYIQGEWETSMDNIDRCLELWDTDGPTKALKYYMQFYRFISPNQWNGFRNIDEQIDLEKIRADQNFDDDDDAEEAPEEKSPTKEDKEASKSKSGKNKSKKEGKDGDETSKSKKKKDEK